MAALLSPKASLTSTGRRRAKCAARERCPTPGRPAIVQPPSRTAQRRWPSQGITAPPQAVVGCIIRIILCAARPSHPICPPATRTTPRKGRRTTRGFRTAYLDTITRHLRYPRDTSRPAANPPTLPCPWTATRPISIIISRARRTDRRLVRGVAIEMCNPSLIGPRSTENFRWRWRCATGWTWR